MSYMNEKIYPNKTSLSGCSKDYVSNDYIHNYWDAVQWAIDESYIITIFGYSASASDKSAVDLLRQAWGAP